MDERFRRKVKDFLAGTLDRAGTLEVLDEVRKSEACRNYLEEQASAAAGARRALRNEASPAAHGCNSVQVPHDSAQAIRQSVDTDWGSMMESRKKRSWRRIIMLGLATAIFAAISSKVFDKGPPPIEPATQVQAAAIAAGLPVAMEPQGRIEVRPMTISAILPAGNLTVKLSILGRDRLLFSREYKASDLGAEFETSTVRGSDGLLQTVEVLLPFPARDEMILEKGARYFYFVELANGQQSLPITLDYQP